MKKLVLIRLYVWQLQLAFPLVEQNVGMIMLGCILLLKSNMMLTYSIWRINLKLKRWWDILLRTGSC